MPVSEARKRANTKWNASRDAITIRVEKEEGAAIREAAAAFDLSVTQYLLLKLHCGDEGRYKKFHEERNFFDWYNTKATENEKKVYDLLFEYSDAFFSEFRFAPGSYVSDFVDMKGSDDNGESWAVDDPFSPPYVLEYFDQIVLQSLKCTVKPLKTDIVGSYNSLTHTLEIAPGHEDKPDDILHELIHIYESVVDTLPKYYHDVLVCCLYRELSSRVPDLYDRLIRHAHLYYGDEITREGGNHDILFFLKSLDLDMRCGFELGTVCGYGRDENGKEDF